VTGGGYEMEKSFVYNYITPGNAQLNSLIGEDISISEIDGPHTHITAGSVLVNYPMGTFVKITPESVIGDNGPKGFRFKLCEDGVLLRGGDNNHVLTSNASTIDITQYTLKTDLPTVPTNVSQLTNDSNFIT
jgi:hypothetical protein